MAVHDTRLDPRELSGVWMEYTGSVSPSSSKLPVGRAPLPLQVQRCSTVLKWAREGTRKEWAMSPEMQCLKPPDDHAGLQTLAQCPSERPY
eukprot:1320667-Rhodomonas_salina.2